MLMAALGGCLAGSVVGLAEVAWLSQTAGFELLLLAWGWGLYGAVGAAVGLGVGAAWAAGCALVRPTWGAAAGPVALGGSLLALGGVVGRYVLNRDVFAEQGLPLWVELTLGVGLLVAGGVIAWRLGRAAVREELAPMTLGSVGLVWPVVLVGLVVAMPSMPGNDPRTQWGASAPTPAPLGDKPDVLFIMVDTLRADHVGAANIDTPALDRLQADGVTFADAWSAASWTRPGTASLWTGRPPSSHTASTKGSRLPADVVTWAEALRSHGVRTGALINNINVTASFGFDQGFDAFVYEAPEYPFGASEAVFGLALYKLVHRVEERLGGGGPVERYYQPADVVLADALAFADAQADARWALFVHLMEPHDPYFLHGPDGPVDGYSRAANLVPDPAEAEGLRERYAGEVVALDRALGRFFDQLRTDGRYDDLLIVLTADHGEELYEHGGWWHGATLYNEQTHVPLVVKLPGNALGGSVAEWQVRTLDVPSTLTAALGVAPDPSWDGRDLLDTDARSTLTAQLSEMADAPDALVGDPGEGAGTPADAASTPDPAPPADAVPAEVCRAARSHPLDRLVLMEEDFEGNQLAAVRAEGFAWHRAAPGGPRGLPERALYDVLEDPGETLDLLDGGASLCSRYPEDWSRDLDEALRSAREASARGAVDAATVEITDAERARLCALGYLSGPECP